MQLATPLFVIQQNAQQTHGKETCEAYCPKRCGSIFGALATCRGSGGTKEKDAGGTHKPSMPSVNESIKAVKQIISICATLYQLCIAVCSLCTELQDIKLGKKDSGKT